MKKKIILGILIILIISLGVIWLIKPREEYDENMLYRKNFKNVSLKYERYDYVLGQNMLVGVEKSFDKGTSFQKVTKELVTVSNEAKFIFLDEALGFIISTGYIRKSNDYRGLKVTKDGGKSFLDANFNYNNENIDLITIEDFPYWEDEQLKLKCSIYEFSKEKNEYQDREIIFKSQDSGINWALD